MGFFSKIKQGLRDTRQNITSKIDSVLSIFTKIDEDLFEELEETLILSDIGATTSAYICDTLRDQVKLKRITEVNEIKSLLKEIMRDILPENTSLDLQGRPSVILVIGVNGVGKTTTIGKLAHNFKSDGKSVLIAAADTFRAAAIEQLDVWADRAGVPVVKHKEGSDAAAVVFDALTAACARNVDIVICDTAGRLHNKKNLMDELSKINRVVESKTDSGAREYLLVLDATTGQNGVNQAREFKNAANITGIVLTKLDGTAKGGIVFTIAKELGIPIKFIGVGEGVDDLKPFDREDFVNAIFE